MTAGDTRQGPGSAGGGWIEQALQEHEEAAAPGRPEDPGGRPVLPVADRERQVLEFLLEGRLNKQIAATLGTSEQTIKVHRARVMRKMAARSIAELVWLAVAAEVGMPRLPMLEGVGAYDVDAGLSVHPA